MRKTILLVVLLGLFVSGSVSAAKPAPSVTIRASRPVVVYGQSVTLSGAISSHQSGETVTLLSEPFAKTAFGNLATATTTAHGIWSSVDKPAIQTTYQASWNATTSPTVTVKVRPLIALKLVSASTGSFSVTATGNRSFMGKYVLVERLTSSGAVILKHVTLDASSSSTFTVRMHHRTSRLRAVMPTSQAAPGYIAGMSNVVTVRH